MPISRRKVLRNLGVVTAAQPFAGAAGAFMFGCKKASPIVPVVVVPVVPDPNSIYVLLEGPWLFSNFGVAAGNLVAVAILDAMHSCVAGKWASGSLSNTLTLSSGDRWSGMLANPPANPFSFTKVLGGAFTKGPNPAVYVKNMKVTPDPKDLTVTVPVPDAVFVGGRLSDGTITDASGKTLGEMPYTATVLRYKPIAGKPLSITFTDGKPKPTTYSAKPGDIMILKLMHVPCSDGMTDIEHVVNAFHDLQLRLGNGTPALTLNLKTAAFDPNSAPDGLSDSILGLGSTAAPCAGAVARTAAPAGAVHPIPMIGTFASCAGGGIASGCDAGLC